MEFTGSGRIKFIRKTKRVTFITLITGSTELDIVQLSFFGDQRDKLKNEKVRIHFRIKYTGEKYISPRGRESIKVLSFSVINNCQRSSELGKKRKTIEDQQIIDANRTYYAFISDAARKKIKTRFEINAFITQFFLKNEYFMANTPILSTTYGGANAKPFYSKLNAGNRKLAMRIAPELNLKRLIIMGFDKVFELGPQFRNEGVDTTHHPEFTTCEFYERGGNMKSVMNTMTEFMTEFIARFKDNILPELSDGVIVESDFLSVIVEGLNDHNIIVSTEELKDFTVQRELCDKFEIECSKEKMLDKLFKKVVDLSGELIFVTNIPDFMSPLAKTSSDTYFADRFELYVNGIEIANGYSELTDPDEQLRKFKLQAESKDDEKMLIDKKYISDLKLGMPPTGGCGFGVERLIMGFFGIHRVTDAVAFPSFTY